MTRNGDPSTTLSYGLGTVQSDPVTTDGTPPPACPFHPSYRPRNHRSHAQTPARPQFHPGHRATQWRISFSVSVSALFGVSALYHRGTWTDAGRRRLQRLDHAMIFFLIAGTATPAFLLDAPGAFGLACLIVLWTLTLTAAAIHLAWMSAPELLVGATFVGLGWAAGLALPWVWIHAGVAPGVLMLAGGLLYTAGALSYHRRWPDPYPSVFGYHEVFHAYVCAAAACQYLAIARFIA